MEPLTTDNPLLATYAISAAIMALKAVAMSWLTVAKMITHNAGFRAPEDIRRTPLNPKPRPEQLLPDERVERVRRIQQNDLENLPFFFVSGFLYVLTDPPLWLAQVLLYGYAASRLLHFAAYYTAQIHDVRAVLWTVGSLIIVYMTAMSLWHFLPMGW